MGKLKTCIWHNNIVKWFLVPIKYIKCKVFSLTTNSKIGKFSVFSINLIYDQLSGHIY